MAKNITIKAPGKRISIKTKTPNNSPYNPRKDKMV